MRLTNRLEGGTLKLSSSDGNGTRLTWTARLHP